MSGSAGLVREQQPYFIIDGRNVTTRNKPEGEGWMIVNTTNVDVALTRGTISRYTTILKQQASAAAENANINMDVEGVNMNNIIWYRQITPAQKEREMRRGAQAEETSRKKAAASQRKRSKMLRLALKARMGNRARTIRLSDLNKSKMRKTQLGESRVEKRIRTKQASIRKALATIRQAVPTSIRNQYEKKLISKNISRGITRRNAERRASAMIHRLSNDDIRQRLSIPASVIQHQEKENAARKSLAALFAKSTKKLSLKSKKGRMPSQKSRGMLSAIQEYPQNDDL